MSQVFEPKALELVLPWEVDEQQEERFKKWLIRIVVPLLIFLLIVPWLPKIELAYEEPEVEIVKTKIVLEPKIIEQPIPEPPKVVPKPVPKKAQPVPARPVVSAPAAPPSEAPQETVQDFAAAQGLSGLSSELSSLRSSLDLKKLQNKNVSRSESGSVEHSATQVLGKDSATRVSAGIEVDDADMRNNAVALAEHASLVVEGASPGGVPGGTAHTAAYGSFKAGMRDMESIRRTLERTKSSVHSIYQKALLDDPNLAGKFTFKLVIEPSGEVSKLTLVASELGVDALEQRILERIKNVNFGAKDVSPTSVEYKFIFLPS